MKPRPDHPEDVDSKWTGWHENPSPDLIAEIEKDGYTLKVREDIHGKVYDIIPKDE